MRAAPRGDVRGTRLDVALIRRHPDLSRRKARDVIRKGQVSVDGETALEAGREIAEGAAIRWDPNKKALPRARLSIPLLYGDESLLVIDKPAGLLTVPSHDAAVEEDTALARVQDYVLHLTPRRPYVGVVHRIDRDTSGAVAFALSPTARQELRALFREHRIERRYAALVEGEPREDRGVVDLPIRTLYQSGRRAVARKGEESLPALTRWSVVERFQGACLLEVELATGRQHQIRIHLAHLAMPILGDAIYGRAASGPLSLEVRRQMLHARFLGFRHPGTGAHVAVESSLPDDFLGALAVLRARRASRSGGASGRRQGGERASGPQGRGRGRTASR